MRQSRSPDGGGGAGSPSSVLGAALCGLGSNASRSPDFADGAAPLPTGAGASTGTALVVAGTEERAAAAALAAWAFLNRGESGS